MAESSSLVGSTFSSPASQAYAWPQRSNSGLWRGGKRGGKRLEDERRRTQPPSFVCASIVVRTHLIFFSTSYTREEYSIVAASGEAIDFFLLGAATAHPFGGSWISYPFHQCPGGHSDRSGGRESVRMLPARFPTSTNLGLLCVLHASARKRGRGVFFLYVDGVDHFSWVKGATEKDFNF